jgi:hypothetical protein
MAILHLLAFIVVVAALVAVWRARSRGAGAMRVSLLVLAFALVAVAAVWYVARG